jgi:sugar phosphate isomerase/epimerase
MLPRFACADFTFPLLEHGNALRLIQMMGFAGVDIGLFEGRSHLQPSTEFAALEKNAKVLSKKLKEVGLLAADVFLQCDNDFAVYATNQPDVKRREVASIWYMQMLEYASILGGKHVTILPGVAFQNETYEDSFKRAIEELNWRVEKAKEHGLILGVEAHVGSLVQQPAQAERLIKSVPGLTLTLDHTHFIRLGVPQQEADTLIQYASHFHARNAAPSNVQTVASENVIDYCRVVQLMKETGYKGYIGVEFFWNEWENGNRVDNVSETILLKRKLEELWLM